MVSTFIDRVRQWSSPVLEPPLFATERRTARLLLRPYRMSDLSWWMAIEADAAVRGPLGWPERSKPDIARHLRARTRHTALHHAGSLLVLAMEHEGRVIGDVSIHLRSVAPATRSAEVGWLLRSDCRGRGFATEAARELLRLAFDDARVNLVTAVIAAPNESSARLASRLGFRLAARAGSVNTYLLSREERIRTKESSPCRPAPASTGSTQQLWVERKAG